MAYKTFVEPSQPCVHAPETGEPRYFRCDAEADRPVVGLNAGDTAYAVAEMSFWVAINATTWSQIGAAGSDTTAWHNALDTFGSEKKIGTFDAYDFVLYAKNIARLRFLQATGEPLFNDTAALDAANEWALAVRNDSNSIGTSVTVNNLLNSQWARTAVRVGDTDNRYSGDMAVYGGSFTSTSQAFAGAMQITAGHLVSKMVFMNIGADYSTFKWYGGVSASPTEKFRVDPNSGGYTDVLALNGTNGATSFILLRGIQSTAGTQVEGGTEINSTTYTPSGSFKAGAVDFYAAGAGLTELGIVTATAVSIKFYTNNNATARAAIDGTDGGVTIGSPTGGSKGTGTLNVATNYYLNGSLLSFGAGSDTTSWHNGLDSFGAVKKIGTSDAFDFVAYVNSVERLRIVQNANYALITATNTTNGTGSFNAIRGLQGSGGSLIEGGMEINSSTYTSSGSFKAGAVDFYAGGAGSSELAILTYSAIPIKFYTNNATTPWYQIDSGGNMGWFNHATAAQQTSGADLTNNVASGGSNDTIANYTDLITYANDAAAIRNDIYQLARKLKQINDGLRAYGLFT